VLKIHTQTYVKNYWRERFRPPRCTASVCRGRRNSCSELSQALEPRFVPPNPPSPAGSAERWLLVLTMLSGTKARDFAYLNDLAIAIEWARANGRMGRAVVDLDVHEGDGTAGIFIGNPCSRCRCMARTTFPFTNKRVSLI
jgi:hypothetical protein